MNWLKLFYINSYPNKIKRKLTYWLRNVLQISCTKNKYLYKYLSIIIYEI